MKNKCKLAVLIISILTFNVAFSGIQALPKPKKWDGMVVLPNSPGDIQVPRFHHEEGMIISCEVEVQNYKSEEDNTIIKVNGSMIHLRNKITKMVFPHNHTSLEGAFFFIRVFNMDVDNAVSFINCQSSYY